MTQTPLSPSPVTVGCYRRRVSSLAGSIIYSNQNHLYSTTGSPVLTADSQIYDHLSRDDAIFSVTSRGDVHALNSSTTALNSLNSHPGLYSALESTTSYIAAGHELSHSVRLIDPLTLQTVYTLTLPGLLSGLCHFKDDLLFSVDDRTISLIDSRDGSGHVRSNPVPSKPVAIFSAGHSLLVSGDDRRIRIFDNQKLKTPLVTTKPASKNGAVSLFSTNGTEIVAIGADEAMTLVVTTEDMGHFKRPKYFAESPWVSAPSLVDGKFSLLSRNGILHQFDDVVQFLRDRQADEDNVDDD
jgi:WD40 repeat protein